MANSENAKCHQKKITLSEILERRLLRINQDIQRVYEELYETQERLTSLRVYQISFLSTDTQFLCGHKTSLSLHFALSLCRVEVIRGSATNFGMTEISLHARNAS